MRVILTYSRLTALTIDIITDKTNMLSKIIELSPTWGLVRIKGSNVKEFLQGQFTVDITQIQANSAQLSAYCNAKGRIISVFVLFYYQEDFYLYLPSNNIPLMLNTLNKYGRFSRIKTEDLSQEYTLYGTCSTKHSQPYAWHYDEHNKTLSLQLPGNRQVIIVKKTGINIKDSELKTTLKELNLPLWQTIDYQYKLPFINAALQEKLLPHPMNLISLNAVSFTKGCYMGQEIIARSQYKGTIKKHVQPISIIGECAINPNDLIVHQGQTIGEIIAVTRINSQEHSALVMFKDTVFEELKTLSPLEINQKSINVRLLT